jgi:hypothetical protein
LRHRKETKRVVAAAPVAKAETVAPEQFLDVAPIEVLQEEVTAAAPVTVPASYDIE